MSIQKFSLTVLLLLTTLSACAPTVTTTTPVWLDIDYRMTSGEVPLLGPTANIGP